MHPLYNILENYSGLLIFEVSGRDYCLDYSIVSSTLKPPFDITIGDGPGYSRILFKNTHIPLINLDGILNQKKPGKINKDSRVIIIEYYDELYGLLVGKIKEIFALDPKYITTSIKFNPEAKIRMHNGHHEYINGSLEIENRNLLLLNIGKITESNKIVSE